MNDLDRPPRSGVAGLVGRDGDLAFVRSRLTGSTVRGATLLLSGEVGIGLALRRRVAAQAHGNPLALVELPAALDREQRGAAPAAVPSVLPLGERLRSVFAALACEALTAADGEALDLFERALSFVDPAEWPFDTGRIRLFYGERLRRRRATKEAREQLVHAVKTFEELGAAPWAARAAAELRAGVHAVSATGRQGAGALTAQEREIAALAATGLTNKQIAERLFLSHRTVGTHLYQAYPKLGIGSRAALRDALAPLGQEDDD